MDFPKWTPKELCDIYNCLPESEDGEEKQQRTQALKECLGRLLTDERMIPVWGAFTEKADVYTTPSATNLTPPSLTEFWYRELRVIIRSIPDEVPKNPPTMTDVVDKIKRIRKHAKELSRALRDTPLDIPLLQWLSDLPQDSTISTMMNDVADRSKEWLKLSQEPQIVSNWGRKGARANYFIRTMSEHFEKLFGSPRYRLLADLASVALDDCMMIDENTVASCLNEWRKQKNT